MVGSQQHPSEVFLAHGHFAHISCWLPPLEDLTFRTVISPLPDAEARALLKLTEYSRQAARIAETLETFETADEIEPFARLSDAQREQVVLLEARLDRSLRSLGVSRESSESPGAFVRLDTRSPKDGVFSLPRVQELLRVSVPVHVFDGGSWSAECQTYDEGCVHRAIIAALEVRSGREALDLMRHSQRVEADLVMGQVVNQGDASSQLVLRRWDSRVDPLCEVRAFVCGGRVTGITQYYETCLVPALVRQRDEIKRLVVDAATAAHGRIAHLLPDDPTCGASFYAIDFALVTAAGSDNASADFVEALLVEINPPPPVSGTVLFRWADEVDRAILTGSSHVETQLRLVEKPVPWSTVAFHPPLKALVDELRGRKSRLASCAIL